MLDDGGMLLFGHRIIVVPYVRFVGQLLNVDHVLAVHDSTNKYINNLSIPYH